MHRSLTYEVVLPTRNRPGPLALAVASILRQTRPPERILVVDSGKPELGAARALAKLDAPGKIQVLSSEEGIAKQRNLGFRRVHAPVVFFTDDDVVWHRSVGAEVLHRYEAPDGSSIAGVCAAEGTGRAFLPAARTWFETEIVPDPFRILSREVRTRRSPAGGGPEEVSWASGFRLSFRSEAFRQFHFDETLGRYSLFEDVDACLSATHRGRFVAARKARIRHLRSPEPRDLPERLGVLQMLNRAYVVCKHAAPDSAAREALPEFLEYKERLYGLGALSERGARRLRAARAARRFVPELLESDPWALRENYLGAVSAAFRIATRDSLHVRPFLANP